MFKRGLIILTLIGFLGVGVIFPKNVFAVQGDYTGVSFSTSGSGNDYPTGITAYNNFFWIVDGFDAEVYKYNPDGTYASFSFDTAGSGNNDPIGITAYNDFFWITDYVDLKVYKYNPDGTYTGTSFDTSGSGSDLPSGIAAYNDFLWITDWNDAEVYKYNPNGTYTGTSFDTQNNSNYNPEGIVSYNGYFWIADDISREVYMYYPSGTKTNFSFDTTSSGNASPIGITYYNNFFWITDPSDVLVYKYEAIDAVIPTISGLYPSDGQVDVLPNTNLNITFSEIMKVGTGNITIKKSSDDSIVEAIDVESGQVVLIGSTTFRIDPSADLEPGISYYVQIDATAFDDLFGNSFAGIADTTTWNFTTDGAPPTVSTLTPTDGAVGVSANSNLLITFDESIVAGVGNILIKKSSDNSIVQTIDATDGGLVEVSGTDVTINPSSNLGLATAYYVQIDAGAFEDSSGNSFGGIADTTTWNFTTGSAVHDGIERVSISDLSEEGDSESYTPSISSDGRYVAFASYATNLVAGDTNGVSDVFVYNRDADIIERISVDDLGEEGDGDSNNPSISSDGRYVAFASYATNLVAGDTNGASDVFVYDRDLNTIERISVDDLGEEGDNNSIVSSISSDGSHIAFESYATNLVAGDTNGASDVFVYDRDLNTIERISVDDLGEEGDGDSSNPSVSSDGRYVAFESYTTNLIADDTNGNPDIFVYDRNLNTIERVSISSLGEEGDSESYGPSISSNGRYIAFYSYAANLIADDTNGEYDIFVYDRDLNTIERVSVDDLGEEGDNGSEDPSISPDGQYVAFYSEATNLVNGDMNGESDAFLYDRDTATIVRISVDDDGNEVNNNNSYESSPSISDNGEYTAFDFSYDGSVGLVPDDNNETTDVFVVYFNRVEEEIEPETSHRTSSGSVPKSKKVIFPDAPVLIPILPSPSITQECLQGHKFSSLTGQPCPLIINVPTAPNFVFLNNLSSGVIHPDVKELQRYLNTHGFSISTSGAGSIGHETSKFGKLTREALIKFQISKGIKPAVGFFGPITRGVVNSN